MRKRLRKNNNKYISNEALRDNGTGIMSIENKENDFVNQNKSDLK